MNRRIGAAVAVVATVIVAILLLTVKPEAPIRTTVCGVIAQPDLFSGKTIQIRAKVVSGMETGGLTDSSCSGFLLVDSLEDVLSGVHGEFAFINSLDDLKQPTLLAWRPIQAARPVYLAENRTYQTLLSFLGKKLRVGEDKRICFQCSLFEVTATMIGRFDHRESHMVAVRVGSEIKTYGVGFGHLSAALSRLVIQSVTDVVATPIDPSVYERDK